LGLEHGTYILSECENEPRLIVMGSGSEVNLLLEAQEILKAVAIRVREVHFPGSELFEKKVRGINKMFF
jgi:transketolase